MRSRSFLSVIAGAALLVGSPAQAGPLLAATWTQTLQGVALTITQAAATCTSAGENLVQQTITCPGVGLGATGSATGGNYSASLTVGLFAVSQFTIGDAIVIGTMASIAGPQAITGNNTMADGAPGVQGDVTVRVAAHDKLSMLASNHTAGSMFTTLVKVPLSVGKAGTLTGYFYVFASFQYITVDFYAWTPNTLTFTGLTTKGAALPDVTAQGSFMMTGGVGAVGTVTLVAPSKISIDGLLTQRRTASFTTLKLTFDTHSTPEPSTLLLLGAGAVGLALVGIRKRS